MRNLLRHMFHLPRKAICLMITGYQNTLSPDHGPLKHLYPYGYCRHEPTCSEYGKQVVLERGAIMGSLLIIKRTLSCHPWKTLDEKKIQKILQKHL